MFSSRQYREDPKKMSLCKFISDLLIVVVAAYVIILFTCSRVTVNGNSMWPAIESGEVMLVNKFSYTFIKPSRYSVAVIEAGNTNTQYVKRVIGLPGETIQIKDGKVYINGEALEDDVSEDAIITAGIASEPLTLGDDEFFVLGDNRNNSEDSRFTTIGVIKRNQIVGKPWLTVSPINDVGFVK